MGILDSKVTIVTGATASLTAAVVAACLGAGATVVTTYRREGDMEQLRARAGHVQQQHEYFAALDMA